MGNSEGERYRAAEATPPRSARSSTSFTPITPADSPRRDQRRLYLSSSCRQSPVCPDWGEQVGRRTSRGHTGRVGIKEAGVGELGFDIRSGSRVRGNRAWVLFIPGHKSHQSHGRQTTPPPSAHALGAATASVPVRRRTAAGCPTVPGCPRRSPWSRCAPADLTRCPVAWRPATARRRCFFRPRRRSP